MNIHSVYHYINPFKGGPNTRKLWQFAVEHCRNLTVVIVLSTTMGLTACGGMPSVRLEVGNRVTQSDGYESFVVAGEPQAALIAREILLSGGNAVDAAAALGFSLAVTLPSSAGLGGGGVCMHYDAAKDKVEVLEFLNSRAPLARPRLARGLFSLHAKYGYLQWPQVVAPAENLARFGIPMSRALAHDLENYGSRLIADRATIEIFMTSQKEFLRVGEILKQPLLASTLSNVRSRFSNGLRVDLYEDAVATTIAKALSVNENKVSQSPPPGWSSVDAQSAKNMLLFLYSSEEVLGSGNGVTSGAFHLSDESSNGITEFIVADAQGKTVTCALTMGRPFGLGVMPGTLGFLLASEAPGDLAPVSPISIAYLVGRDTKDVALAAISSGSGAMARVMSVVEDIDQSGNRYMRRKETQIRERPGISMAYCELVPPTGRAQCRISAGVSGYGYAAMVNLEK